MHSRNHLIDQCHRRVNKHIVNNITKSLSYEKLSDCLKFFVGSKNVHNCLIYLKIKKISEYIHLAVHFNLFVCME